MGEIKIPLVESSDRKNYCEQKERITAKAEYLMNQIIEQLPNRILKAKTDDHRRFLKGLKVWTDNYQNLSYWGTNGMFDDVLYGDTFNYEEMFVLNYIDSIPGIYVTVTIEGKVKIIQDEHVPLMCSDILTLVLRTWDCREAGVEGILEWFEEE